MKLVACGLVVALVGLDGCAGRQPQSPPSPVSIASTSTSASESASASASASVIVSTEPGIFVGGWYGHGRGLVVRSDGDATETYRIYRFCSQDPTPPCDQDSPLVAGGHVTMRITRVVTADHRSTASAMVLTSSDPGHVLVGSTLALVLSGDIVTVGGTTFCDAKAHDQCGA